MKYIISNLRVGIGYSEDEVAYHIAKNIGANQNQIENFRILKESIDARRKGSISYVLSVLVELPYTLTNKSNDIKEFQPQKRENIIYGNKKIENRPVIVGSGPCGLFAAYILAKNGYRPLVIERGLDMEKRTQVVNSCWKNSKLCEHTNVQFGEGGAGTFSDGKLTTRINDPECESVLQILRECGAPEDILYKAKPHIGSDNLKKVIINLRNKIIENGGEILFNTKLTDIKIINGQIAEIEVNKGNQINTNVLVLAIGHSSRDTFVMVQNKGINIEQKPFSIGVRIEHPQELINSAQFGNLHDKPGVPVADYQLFQKIGNRTAYTFCMCPGGVVVASASEKGTVVTNGMSDYKRNKTNANSAFVVSVNQNDFESSHPLAGIEFQRRFEKMAFDLGGGDNAAPIQRLEDFAKNEKSTKIGIVKPSYTGKTNLSNLNLCMPSFVSKTLISAIPYFEAKIKGYSLNDAILTGMETRTSSPVRILRNDNFEAVGIMGLFPAGEGAGYAGGIMSAAVDGIKSANALMAIYKNI